MEQETAGSGVTPSEEVAEEVTSAENTSAAELTIEDQGVSMRLRAVTRALISAAQDEDEELRLRASESLARLGQAHPLTVMAEWLTVFTSARDLKGKGQKKKDSRQESDFTNYSNSKDRIVLFDIHNIQY